MKKLLSVLSVACGALLLSGCGGDPTAKEEVQKDDKDDSSIPLLISCEACGKEVSKAGTVLWNGPMGVFEIEDSSKGTFAIAQAVAEGGGLSIIGGGDSVKAINQSGYGNQVTFMSTGGGASLEFLEGKELPGVSILDQS